MSLKKTMGKLLVCVVLEMGALSGVPIRPEEIEQLMKMSEPCVTQTVRNDEGEDPKDGAAM